MMMKSTKLGLVCALLPTFAACSTGTIDEGRIGSKTQEATLLETLNFESTDDWTVFNGSGTLTTTSDGISVTNATQHIEFTTPLLSEFPISGGAYIFYFEPDADLIWGHVAVRFKIPSLYKDFYLGPQWMGGMVAGEKRLVSLALPGDLQTALADTYSDLQVQVIVTLPTGTNFELSSSAAPSGPSCDRTDLRFEVWPITGVEGVDWVINNYTDMNPSASMLDWAGQTDVDNPSSRTYNNHNGMDVDVPSFAWMDNEWAYAVAAAAGEVVDTQDGNFDRNTASTTSSANYVKLLHDNGFETWYWHLKKDSVLVAKGDIVDAGQPLGVVGSSGNSTAPHLHFEVQGCDPANPSSLSVVEPNSVDPALNMWTVGPGYDDQVRGVMDTVIFGGGVPANPAVSILRTASTPEKTVHKPGELFWTGASVSAGADRNRSQDVVTLRRQRDGAAPLPQWDATFTGRFAHQFPAWSMIFNDPGMYTLSYEINGQVMQTRRIGISTVDPGLGEVARHGIPAEDVQDDYTDVTAADYYPAWLDGFDVGGATYFNILYRPGDGRWVTSQFGMDALGYQQLFNDRVNVEGDRLTFVDSYLEGGQVRYSAIFDDQPTSGFSAYHDRSETEHLGLLSTNQAADLVPTVVSVVMSGGEPRYSALYEYQPGETRTVDQVRVSDYQALYNTRRSQNLQIRYINGYTRGGEPWFSVVWGPETSAFEARHGLDALGYQNEWNTWTGLGYFTHYVTGYDSGAEPLFAAVWSPESPIH